MRRVLLVWALLVALVGAGGVLAKRPADNATVAAGSALLARAADQSEATSFRFEGLFSFDTPEFQVEDVPLMRGEHTATAEHQVVDLGALFAAVGETPPDLAGVDLSVETIVDGATLYLRMPFIAALMELDPSVGAMFGALGSLGDQWGRIDVVALGDALPSDVADAFGSQTADPTKMLDAVRDAADVESLGADTIRDAAVQGYRAHVSIAEVMRATGTDPEALIASLPADEAEAFVEFRLPIEVWVDDAGYVRRMVVSFDEDTFQQLDLPEEAADNMSFSASLDFFDYGDPGIAVTPPPESVDITADFLRLLELED